MGVLEEKLLTCNTTRQQGYEARYAKGGLKISSPVLEAKEKNLH